MTLWNDVFRIEISTSKEKLERQFKGSLKNAIRLVMREHKKGGIAQFYDSKGNWLKEVSW